MKSLSENDVPKNKLKTLRAFYLCLLFPQEMCTFLFREEISVLVEVIALFNGKQNTIFVTNNVL